MSKYICESCGGNRRTAAGYFVLELFLWCLFILPGLAYSLWRVTSKGVCRDCGGRLIPSSSPRGKLLRAQLGAQPGEPAARAGMEIGKAYAYVVSAASGAQGKLKCAFGWLVIAVAAGIGMIAIGLVLTIAFGK